MWTPKSVRAVLLFCAVALVVALGPERAGVAQGPAPPAQGRVGA